MKDSHKVCKKTQDFVKKKLKAFPTRYDGFYTNKTGATAMDMVNTSTTWENFRWSELFRDLMQWLFRCYGTFRSNRRVRENTVRGDMRTSSVSMDQHIKN